MDGISSRYPSVHTDTSCLSLGGLSETFVRLRKFVPSYCKNQLDGQFSPSFLQLRMTCDETVLTAIITLRWDYPEKDISTFEMSFMNICFLATAYISGWPSPCLNVVIQGKGIFSRRYGDSWPQ